MLFLVENTRSLSSDISRQNLEKIKRFIGTRRVLQHTKGNRIMVYRFNAIHDVFLFTKASLNKMANLLSGIQPRRRGKLIM